MRIYALILLTGLFCSCGGKKTIGITDYKKELSENNSMNQTKEMKDLRFNCRYVPHEELVLREINSSTISANEYNSIIKKYEDLVYFDFVITNQNSDEIINNSGKDNYFQMLDYFSNALQKDFFLVCDKDTLTCSAFYYERNFDLSPNNVINLGFARSKLLSGKQKELRSDLFLVYDDKVLGTGPLTFKYKKSDINNLPNLDYEKN